MKTTYKIATSIALATLLLVGCGSGSTSNGNGTQNPSTTKTSGKIALEADKLTQIKRDLQSRNITYQTSSYSKDKSTIMIVGLEKGKTTFYKFDANTLELLDQFEFEIDGIIGVKTAEDGEKFTIISSKDSEATDYTLDMANKKLEKKTEYHLKDPKKIIQAQLGDTFTVESFMFTPSKMGGLVIASNDSQRKLFLYGMEDPANPLQEYAIFEGSSKQHIQNIILLGNGIITFEITNEDEPNKINKRKYDYFNKKELSSEYVGKNHIDHASYSKARNRIRKDFEGHSDVYTEITPTNLGAITRVKDGDFFDLYLYGLENIEAPKQELLITRVKTKYLYYEIIKNGVLEYSYVAKDSGDKHTVTYDYFKNHITDEIIQKNDFYNIEKEMQDIFDEKWGKTGRWKRGAPEKIKVIAKLTDSLYLVKHSISWFDGKFGAKILNFSTKEFKKTLAWRFMGGGEVAEDITIDRENHRVNYKVALERNVGVHIDDSEINKYVTGKESRYYDYLTDTITAGMLPLKIDDSGRENHETPFYSPDEKYIFTTTSAGDIDLYDDKGQFIKKIYASRLPKARYSAKQIEDISFTDGTKISFEEQTGEYDNAHNGASVHEAQTYIKVVLDYVSGHIDSQSDVQYRVNTIGYVQPELIISKNSDKIIKIVNNAVITYELSYGGSKDKELYKATGRNKLFDLKNMDTDTVTFKEKVLDEDYAVKEVIEFVVNYKTGEIISKISR